MTDMKRRDTLSNQLVRKATLCLDIAQLMLGKGAPGPTIEDQAVALMHIPERELRETRKRLESQTRTAKSRSLDGSQRR